VNASLVRAGKAWSLIVHSRSYEVSFAEPQRGELTVYVNGVAVPVDTGQGRLKAAPTYAKAAPTYAPAVGAVRRSLGEGGSRPGRVDIIAPMPGRIVRVLVKKGDRVAARQGLVVVEAMKMENELRSPKDGVVTDVRAVEGGTVEARSVLMTVE